MYSHAKRARNFHTAGQNGWLPGRDMVQLVVQRIISVSSKSTCYGVCDAKQERKPERNKKPPTSSINPCSNTCRPDSRRC